MIANAAYHERRASRVESFSLTGQEVIDSIELVEYYRSGVILQTILRRLLRGT